MKYLPIAERWRSFAQIAVDDAAQFLLQAGEVACEACALGGGDLPCFCPCLLPVAPACNVDLAMPQFVPCDKGGGVGGDAVGKQGDLAAFGSYQPSAWAGIGLPLGSAVVWLVAIWICWAWLPNALFRMWRKWASLFVCCGVAVVVE